MGTVFDVVKKQRQSVHVLEGKVRVEVKVQDAQEQNVRTAETVEVALGQEINLDSEEIVDLQNRRPIQLLSLLSDELRDSEWYGWNRSEDLTGGATVSVEDAVKAQGEQEALKSQAPQAARLKK